MGSIYAKDVVQAATAWLGYHEGSNNWNIFAKYLDDVGYFKPQEKQNIPWCAIFCDFCVWQAAIPKDRDDEAKMYDAQWFQFQPSYWNVSAGAREYADYFKSAGAWYTNSPEIGDMCFFNVNGSIGHVGIVVDTDEYITTIEGNAGDQVQKKWYSYDDIGDKIAGFGRPRYDGYENPADVDHSPVEDSKPDKDDDNQLEVFKVSVNDFLAIRTGPSVDCEKVGELYNGAVVTVIDRDGNWAKITGGLWVCADYLE